MVITVEIEGISKAYIDIIAHIHDGKMELNIRSIGKPLSHMSLRKDERYSNIYTLYKMASEVEYDYVMGMNQTRIVVI